MATPTPVFFTFFLCVLLCALAVSSKPLAHDSGSMQSSNSADRVLKRSLKLDTVLSPKVESARDLEQVQSLDSVPVPSLTNSKEGLRRDKREVVTGNHQCPGDMIWFMRKCRTFEAYERLVKLEEEE